MKVKRNVKVFSQVITPENVEAMSEMLAIVTMRDLMQYGSKSIGYLRIQMLNDIAHKNERDYVLSDSYDFVQEIGLVLSMNIGKRLNDTYCYNKHGKRITVEMFAQRNMCKLLGYKCVEYRRIVNLNAYKLRLIPYTALDKLELEESYNRIEEIIESLDLNERQKTALYCRMNGLSYPEIGRIIGRAQSTTHDTIKAISKKYLEMYHS